MLSTSIQNISVIPFTDTTNSLLCSGNVSCTASSAQYTQWLHSHPLRLNSSHVQTSVFIMRSCFVLIAVGLVTTSPSSSSSSLSSLDSTVFLSLKSSISAHLHHLSFIIIHLLPHTVSCIRFCFWLFGAVCDFFCLCIKYLGNRLMGLRQILKEGVFGPSLERV